MDPNTLRVDGLKRSEPRGSVRPFTPEDLPQVVRLRRGVFQHSRWTSEDDLARYFERVFLKNPWPSPDLQPLVYEARTGEVVGFVGAVPRPMTVSGKAIRSVTVTQFMVAPEYRGGPGRELLNGLFRGPQDITFSDVANEAARRSWEAGGGVTARLYGFFWTVPLGAARSALFRKGANAVSRGLRGLTDPLLAIVHAKSLPSSARRSEPEAGSRSLDAASMVASWPNLIASDVLRPEYDEASLEWLLEEVRWKWGEAAVRIGRVGDDGISGWFIYSLRSDGVAFVLQLVAEASHKRLVLEHAIDHARRAGAVALRGRLQPELLPVLTDLRCSFDADGPLLLVHSHDCDLLQKVLVGDMVLTGLDGEWWMDF
jgi:hypothetical protein